jgi:hypothetical protein
MKFRATVELGGKTATGIEIPDDVVAALGSGSRPPVTVTVGGSPTGRRWRAWAAASWSR